MGQDTSVEALYALAGIRPGVPRTLENEDFAFAKFERLLIGPGTPPQSAVRVVNCSFSSCMVGGEFRIAPGVELDNVVFVDVLSPDLMTINTETILKNVIVKGSSKLRGLWVKPSAFSNPGRKQLCRDWSSASSDKIDVMLDFSEFYGGETEVVGLPLSKLRWNSEHHIPIHLKWEASEQWKQVNLPLTSFWSLRLKRLRGFGVTEGIYSLPAPNSKSYAQTKEEMARLAEVGLLRTA